jgi:peptide methionine sulfoxide reductase MsrA
MFQRNREGPDVGKRYRAAIFHRAPERKAAAEASREHLEKNGNFRRPSSPKSRLPGRFIPPRASTAISMKNASK